MTLKAVRRGHRGQVTKLFKKFDEIEKNSDLDKDDVKLISDAVEQKKKTIVDLNEKILDLTSEEDVEEEIQESDEYMFNLESKLRKIRKIYSDSISQNVASTSLDPNANSFTQSYPTNSSITNANVIRSNETEINVQPTNFDNFRSMQNTHRDLQSTNNLYNQGFSSVSNSSQNHRLPKLDLPHFDGEILQWQTFWDSYESTIHFNSTLTEIQKFSYLKAQLHGHAAQTIEGFALTNANYTTAVNLLKDRFGSPHKIIHAYMKALMDLPSPSNDLNSLRRYGDHLETYVRGLECLGQTQEMYGALLVPIIISKLPVETRKSIAREYDSDHITLNNLRKAITKEARILEAGQFTDREGLHTTATFLTEAQCKSQNRCKKCNKKHHTSICGEQATDGKGQDSKEKSTVVSLVKTEEPETAVMHTSQHTSVLLKTAIAPIAYGKQITEASILFDEGAQRSFITQSIADKLQIRPSGTDTIELSAFGDKEKNIRHLDTATVQLQTDKGELVNINALIVPDIAVPLQNQTKYFTRNLPYLKNLKLAHPANNADSFEISLLIGADYYWDIVQDHVIRGNGPTAVASKIGYLLSGPVIRNGEKSLTSSVLLNVTSHHTEESDIEKFWNLESLGICLPQKDDEESFVKTYQQDCIKFENERYSAKLPWKLDHPDLPSNIMIAKARTESTTRRLSREPHLLRKYSEIIEDQMKRGFIEKVNDENDNGKSTHYIPHHAVKKDSTTTPIRIVYDCSCKKSPDHASLNDCLMSTPPDLNDLTKILMGFRTKKYAISTDIEKAFLHIGLDEKDRDFTRFFWLSDTDNPSSTLTTYRFKSILFGATSSPFILNATLLKHLDACNTNISAMMKNDLYVDNILSSLENEDDAEKYFVQARSLMSEAGFNLRSWSSNCSKLTDLAKKHNVCEKETFVKILGLKWDTVKDTITFQKVDLFDIELPNITKREILKQSSRIYDPLGLLSPVSVRAKILMQTLREQKFEWDEPLPLEIQTTWKNLAKDLEKTTYTELKRPYFPNLPD
ncbi:uncharacterized protein LOC134726541 [Mytilus trossulus]|uniref:uncharacterized protein LOC134726541 n=1 Tax=Mytilus trossulus TaxID=6551 RepID=UPI00300585E0